MYSPLRFAVLVVAILSVSCNCTASRNRDAVVLVTAEGVSLQQLTQRRNPELNQVLKSGAVGLMNNRSYGRQTFPNNAVTIGAGSRACGSRKDGFGALVDDAELGFNRSEMIDGEHADSIYSRNIGISSSHYAVVHTGIESLKQINCDQRYTVVPGLLGTQLEEAGVDVSVFGNSDQGKMCSRCATAIAMNTNGLVRFGDVGSQTLEPSRARAFGVRSDFDYLTRRVINAAEHRSFTVVELGDGARLEASRAYLGPAQYEMQKTAVIRDCCRFLVRLDKYFHKHNSKYLLVLAVTSQDSTSVAEGDLLTPVIMMGTGIRPGMLTSDSTKRPGLVMNLDLAPTVLKFFGVEPDSSIMGRPIFIRPHSSAISALQSINDPLVKVDSGRLPILKTYIIVLSSAIGFYVVLLLTAGCKPGHNTVLRKFKYLRPVLIALMLVPLSLLVAPALHIYNPTASAVFLVASTLTAACILNTAVHDTRLILACVGLLTSSAICSDLMLGAPLQQKSILSYSAITGIRFYGLGNEYSGVLLGSVLLGVFSLLDFLPAKRWFAAAVALVYVALFFIIGSPDGGSDFGGMLAASTGFSVAFVQMLPGAVRRQWLPLIVLLNVFLFGGVMAMNIQAGPGEQTHIGHAFSQAHQSGVGVLWEIAVRKWMMNLQLIRYSFWAIALGSLCTVLIVLAYRPIGAVRNALSGHTLLNAGFTGILVGMVVAFLTNDSGVVMAATGLLYLAFPLILMVEAARKPVSSIPADTSTRQGSTL